MLTRVRSPRSGRPSEGNTVATSAHDRFRGASSAPDSRTAPCRHAGSGTKRGNGDRRVATVPRGARGTATPAPSRSHAQANDQSRRGNPSSYVFVLDGFRTGDLVRATVPIGRHRGAHRGCVAVRASGSFNLKTLVRTLQGIAHRYCRLLMRADGYTYSLLTSQPKDAPHPRPYGQGFRREE